MNKAIKLMHYAGMSLKDFRKLSKPDRAFLWMMVVANYQWKD